MGDRRARSPALGVQSAFDPLPQTGVESRQLRCAHPRAVRYLDMGDPSWRPVVFFGGLATSLGAFGLTEFARSTRESLVLRALSIERNGFGETPFDPHLGLQDAVDDVLAVLAERGVSRYAIVAFSGGAPFAGALAARAPERVLSLHLASPVAGGLIATVGTARELFADPVAVARDPGAMWRYPPASPVHRIPGFADGAAAEGMRALAGGNGRGAQALAHEWDLLCHAPAPDLTELAAPVYLYWGEDDVLVPPAHARAWATLAPNVVAMRGYAGEGHDVQYRHWDQILLDAAGRGAGILASRGRRARMVSDRELGHELAAGAKLGLPCWQAA